MEGPHVHNWHYLDAYFQMSGSGGWFARRYCKDCHIIETFDLTEVKEDMPV